GIALHVEPKDLTDRTGQWADLGLYPVRQIGVLKAFQNLLTGEVVSRGIVKRKIDKGQAELRVGEDPHRVRKAAELDLQGDGDLFFDFLRRVPGKQRDH